MTAGPIQHIALASVAIGVIALLGLLPRFFLRTDPVLRYRLLAWFLPVAVLALPAQIAVTAFTPDWARVRFEPEPDSRIKVLDWSNWLQTTDAAESSGFAPAARTASLSAGPLATSDQPVQSRITPLFKYALPVGYLSGVLIVLMVFIKRIRSAARVLRRCRPVTDAATLSVWTQLEREFGLNDRVRLLACEGLSAPACWGVWRPAVIVPVMTRAPIDKGHLRCAIRHELVHLRRRDPLFKVLQTLLTAGFWFNPLVWLYCRALDRDRELSCDALVVRETRKPRTYAMALLAFCERAAQPARVSQLSGFGSIVRLQRRLEMIARAQTGTPRNRSRLMLAGMALALAAIMTTHLSLAAAINTKNALTSEPRGQSNRPDPMDIHILKADSGAIRMAAIDAMTEGREPAHVFKKWRQYAERQDPSLRGREIPPGSWLTDQETVVAAFNPRIDGNVLVAKEFSMSLPEGSALQAILEGESITLSLGKEGTHLSIRNGSIRIVDENGVVRAAARVEDRSLYGAVLEVGASLANDEASFRVHGVNQDGKQVNVRVELDADTGRPEGETQPPHGSIRWQKFPQDDKDKKPFRLKMQWIYDLNILQHANDE